MAARIGTGVICCVVITEKKMAKENGKEKKYCVINCTNRFTMNSGVRYYGLLGGCRGELDVVTVSR